jgi:small-conductance mechanosensitive channel
MFETRSQAWREVGLLRQISPRAVRRARLEVLLLIPLFLAVIVVHEYRKDLLGVDTKDSASGVDTLVNLVTVIALLILGWAVARDIGRVLGPALFRRMDPATAGTAGFLVRLVTVAVALASTRGRSRSGAPLRR